MRPPQQIRELILDSFISIDEIGSGGACCNFYIKKESVFLLLPCEKKFTMFAKKGMDVVEGNIKGCSYGSLDAVHALEYWGHISSEEAQLFEKWFKEAEKEWFKARELSSLRERARHVGYKLVKKELGEDGEHIA